MADQLQHTISPYDQVVRYTRQLLSKDELSHVLDASVTAQRAWRRTSLKERCEVVLRWTECMSDRSDEISLDLAQQMGRPISSKGELRGVIARTKHLVSISSDCLDTVQITDGNGPTGKSIVKQALGVIGIISPWNYPLTCIINTLIPALLAGNSVILKPAPQTPRSAETIREAFIEAGLPSDVLQVVHLSREDTLDALVADPRVNLVVFTGSVEGGRAVAQAATSGLGFKGVTLELGGKDPAYVRGDAGVKKTAAALVDASFFNTGQSCCSVERIYVHQSIHDEFVEHFVSIARGYRLGDPMSQSTNLGPVISLQSAARIRKQVDDAVTSGARLVLSESHFSSAKRDTTCVGPQVLTHVNHDMSIMRDETFGPVAAIMAVKDDDEALKLMNNSQYGLTASVWTHASDEASIKVFERFVEELESGTVYLNAADSMDAALPWTGVKDSGRGVSLSSFGFDQVVRLKAVKRVC